MPRINLDIPKEDRDALMKIAEEEMRPLKNQILFLLREKLREEDLQPNNHEKQTSIAECSP
jgi:hypothetical protein